MIHVRLSDEDRERLGGPEWLDLDPYSVTAREAATIQRGFDLEGEKASFETPGDWRKAISGGEGDTLRWNFAAWVVLVWLALRRVGVTASLTDLDFDLDKLAYKGDPPTDVPPEELDPEASPGKDDEPGPPPSASEPNEISTP